MNTKRTALTVGVAGTVAGLAGLALLATPAGAGEAPPALPPISAQELVQSVLSTQIPAMSGAVRVEENLGLPLPILPSGAGDGVAARVYTDGTGRGRIQLAGRMSEKTIIEDGSTLWLWDSADRSVRKVEHGAGASQKAPEQLADPASAAQQLVSAMQKDSTVTVDGTARVAERPVYQLVLTPKPTEKTLLREVRVAVDSETRVPLRLEVLANGQADPAVRIGFTEFSPGPQDPGLFRFTPPPGAEVTEHKPGEAVDPKGARDLLAQLNPQVVGEGWDIVLVGKVPANLASAAQEQTRARGMDVRNLLSQFAKPVSGPFGTGWVVSTKVGTALFTVDGRAAIGFVPEQVLIDALGQVR
ncbi:MAG TPA: outer membrane lipoprotein carrier protein LolA [Actinophytocola sp.]|uniref:LolA family protein n=1 Tax=Actinophytocola sp. TaxID=1872138 RepID=UPI002DDD5EFE|nr:outer membrane lipoprotein carrier protein LolA [Actinophytocola sp.]HEV2781940.1 outer membrane lipoprotein carrier protein LolA [Actinophytocola sp.]